METVCRIGFFGGSFNPPHKGHVAIAQAARRELELSRVLFMVAKDPPHKEIADHVDARLRYELTRCALLDDPTLEASERELLRAGKSYTLLTAQELRAAYPDAALYCIVGADMLADLPTWYHVEELLRLVQIIGIGRGGVDTQLEDEAEALRAMGARVEVCTFIGPEISSTMVREAVRDALPISGYVNEAVAKCIYENGLYQSADIAALQSKLKESLKPSRYIHTMGVVRTAIDLAARYDADGRKARLAALLHDCAKQSAEEQLARAARYGLDVSELARVSTGIIHGPLGAELARREYSITDAEVLSAIACHTLCKEDMSALDKIVYLADKIEPGRDYEGVAYIRAQAEISLDAGVLACMEQSIAYVEKEGKALHPGVLAARAYIQKNLKEA